MKNMVILLLISLGVVTSVNAKSVQEIIENEGIYKIVAPHEYNPKQQDDCVALSDLDKASGFIHASYGDQVEATLNKFFKQEHAVVLLQLDIDALLRHSIKVISESNKIGGALYPHLYAEKIPVAAIKYAHALIHAVDGSWVA